ncbi:hypothetical protein [Corynebacterium pseudopelargi]|uniref:Uncharacterized protein n=1 Tax=Corynebacterium pseudopelargi TaxID=2080757 RepID=A0A3G6IST4_9CORY|nr:hypothetical protein [Corynebacterium pseudopelargi]AZA08715.1 hypothetical protein CPPEL_02920 [Corynebacterium pseudopelargi]
MITKEYLVQVLETLGWRMNTVAPACEEEIWVNLNEAGHIRVPMHDEDDNDKPSDYQHRLDEAALEVLRTPRNRMVCDLYLDMEGQREYTVQVYVAGRWAYYKSMGHTGGVLTTACPHAATWFKTKEEAEEHAATSAYPTAILVRTVHQPELVDATREQKPRALD